MRKNNATAFRGDNRKVVKKAERVNNLLVLANSFTSNKTTDEDTEYISFPAVAEKKKTTFCSSLNMTS